MDLAVANAGFAGSAGSAGAASKVSSLALMFNGLIGSSSTITPAELTAYSLFFSMVPSIILLRAAETSGSSASMICFFEMPPVL